MGKPYSLELDYLSTSFTWACEQDVSLLKLFIERWAGDYVCIVGSGGSYSAAHAIAELREIAFHSVSRPMTPMELATKATLVPSTKVFLLSAEGKNTDVLSAAMYAMQSDMACAALTLTKDNQLTKFSAETDSVRVFAYQMPWEKDGYLATNSLIATLILFYRAFFGDIKPESFVATLFKAETLLSYRDRWTANTHLKQASTRNVIVLHDPSTKSFAIDLESKLAEAAIAKVEIADYRQFAHGRHLQLATERSKPLVITAFSKNSSAIAAATTKLIPDNIPVVPIEIPGSTPEELVISSLTLATLITEAIAKGTGQDPGQPDVPSFGREIYRLDASLHYKNPNSNLDKHYLAAARKLNTPHVNIDELENVVSASHKYEAALSNATYKAIISDFDGTLCNAESRYVGMCPLIARRISTLIEEGITFSLASGRGGSLQTCLRSAFAPELHRSIWVGYYGGSIIQRLDEDLDRPATNPEFQELLSWLGTTVYRAYVRPLDELGRGGQLTIRIPSPEHSRKLRVAIRNWLNGSERASWRVFCSGHSVDVLDEKTSKINVVDFISSTLNIDANKQILRLGDNGDEEGNDFELLSTGLSLSADRVSASLESCWNFAAPGSRQASATGLYLRSLFKTLSGHGFKLVDNAALKGLAP